MPFTGLGWPESRQQTCLIKLLLLPGGKMFQGINPLRHLIGANDERIRDMHSIRIGELPPQPRLLRRKLYRNSRLT
jgi:hypothetical protein